MRLVVGVSYYSSESLVTSLQVKCTSGQLWSNGGGPIEDYKMHRSSQWEKRQASIRHQRRVQMPICSPAFSSTVVVVWPCFSMSVAGTDEPAITRVRTEQKTIVSCTLEKHTSNTDRVCNTQR